MEAKILNIEMRDVNPLGSGRSYPPRRLSVLNVGDKAAICKRPPEAQYHLPRVVNRRFLSGSRVASIVSTHFSDDFCLDILNSLWGTTGKEVIGNDNEWYILSLRLSGDTLESVCDQDYLLRAYSCYLVHYRRGMNHAIRSVSDQPLIEACMTFRPTALAQKLGLPRSELIRLLNPEQGSNPFFSRCDMTAQMERIVYELRGRSLREPTYRLHAEAAALQLTALYLEQLQAQATLVGTVPSRGRPLPLDGELRSLRQVKRYMEENYYLQPTIDDLCRLVGFSRRKLTSAFRKAFGKSIQEYQQEVCMELAKALFFTHGNVSRVSEKVGYAYPGNFAKAFQRYTGMAPKTYLNTVAARPLKPAGRY